jgi:redox-sensitive bicupin YhaK (pirin superfamily)
MIELRKSEDRGTTQLDWLDSRHTFSFGEYYDLKHMGFGVLRVINEDIVNPATGFGTHPHRDMEILTYVLDGALEHKDTLGTGSIIRPGHVQRMSAGTGISHSEYNPLTDGQVHLLQIWIIPERKGLSPSYEQKNFTAIRKPGELTLVASRDEANDSLTIHQDASLYVLDLAPGQPFRYKLKKDRMVWLQVTRGDALLNEQRLKQGDGVAVSQEKTLEFQAPEKAEILIFDLPRDIPLK